MEDPIEYIATLDSDGNKFDGGKNYKLHLPPDIPAKHFWSVIVYENDTSLIISSEQKWPSVFSNSRALVVNHDGSTDILFGPEEPAGIDRNWIQTIPGRSWHMILRLYGPTEAWLNKEWRPGEPEEVNKTEYTKH